jgi:hypothetical protein
MTLADGITAVEPISAGQGRPDEGYSTRPAAIAANPTEVRRSDRHIRASARCFDRAGRYLAQRKSCGPGGAMSTGGFGDQPGEAADQPTQGWDQPGQFGQQPGASDQPGPFSQPDYDTRPGSYGQQGPPGSYGQPGPGQFGQQPGWQPPYGQPGPYVQGSAGWPQMAGRRTNSLAIAALCCAIGQVIAGPFAGIAAIVLGTVSLNQIRQSGEDGRGMAITGLVLGIVGTVLAVFLLIFLLAIVHGVSTNFGNGGNF